jgi:NADPH-dependent 2,4-dienoyl-CoA reductase/sulfur reductase-like enzyme
MDFLVIGADAAGMSAASRARRNRPDVKVTVLEKTSDVSYSACGLPYNIADPMREIDDLVVRQADVFREKQGIHLYTGHIATTIRPAEHKVLGQTLGGEAFTFSYNRLLIATGASPIIPAISGIDLPGVMPLKNLEHGRAIKSFIKFQGVQKVIILGMGYIALEMCEALRTRAIKVDMIKPGPVFLPWLDESLAQKVRQELEANGVNTFVGHAVERIEKSGNQLIAVGKDLALVGDMILVAAGVRPNSELAAQAGIALGPQGAIAVDHALRTSAVDVYAAGDCADAFHVVTGERVWIPLALRANRAGWAAADHVCGQSVNLPGVAGTAVFKVFDLEVARTGLNEKEARQAGFDPATVTILSRSKAHAHPGAGSISVHMLADKKSGRLLGVQMVGKEGVAHRINAPAVALHANMTVEAFSQSDLAYAPPFGPVWDPTLTAAIQLLKQL